MHTVVQRRIWRNCFSSQLHILNTNSPVHIDTMFQLLPWTQTNTYLHKKQKKPKNNSQGMVFTCLTILANTSIVTLEHYNIQAFVKKGVWVITSVTPHIA